jgi:hypothetical protein
MPFCQTCGSDVTGKSFCVQCGTPSSAPPPAPLPPAKKASPLLWIVVGIFAFFVLIGVAIMSAGLFLAKKVVENPARALAKIVAISNPDVEVVSADEARDTVTLKDRKTGETVTLNFDDVRKGRIVFSQNGKESVVQAREGSDGTLEISSGAGKIKFGSGGSAKLPEWAPVYPGVTPEANFSMQGGEGEGGTYQFTTKDSPQAVLDFFKSSLDRGGFKITGNLAGEAGAASGGVISAQDEAAHRTIVVTVGSQSGGASVNVIYGTKK